MRTLLLLLLLAKAINITLRFSPLENRTKMINFKILIQYILKYKINKIDLYRPRQLKVIKDENLREPNAHT